MDGEEFSKNGNNAKLHFEQSAVYRLWSPHDRISGSWMWAWPKRIAGDSLATRLISGSVSEPRGLWGIIPISTAGCGGRASPNTPSPYGTRPPAEITSPARAVRP